MARTPILATTLFFLLQIPVLGGSDIEFAPYLGQTPPGNTKRMFAQGIVSTSLTAHGAISFTPDGRELYWSVLQPPTSLAVIMECHVDDETNTWTTPAPLAFSGVHNDNGPFLNSDASRLYFMSFRPETPGEEEGRSYWYVDRLVTGWSDPTLLGEPFSSAIVGWQGSMTENGDIFFVQSLPHPQNRDVFRSRLVASVYQPIERLNTEVNSGDPELAPFVSSDGGYIIFTSGRDGGYGGFDLWICFSDPDGNWGEAQNLGPTVNTAGTENFPSVSPDGEYMFFAADGPGNYDYYWISASVIEDLRPPAGRRQEDLSAPLPLQGSGASLRSSS